MISANNGSTLTTYTYDYRNRLTGVTQGGTAIATYAYDALDRRIGIKDNGTQTWTVYNGSDADATPYADFNGSGTLTQRYLFGPGVVNGAVVDEILARTSSGGTTAWYVPDKLGSVRDIVSPTGTELDHIVYDSFGGVLTETNATNGDRFKYAGMEYDSAIGQYYDRARYYNSVTGRFMGQDPLLFAAGSPNLYGYVGNDTLNATDPAGLSAIGDMMHGASNILSGLVQDAKTMYNYSGAALSGAGQGLVDGGAMVANAATFQMTPLNNHVQGLIAMHGGGYAAANFFANAGVTIAYAVVVPCGAIRTGIGVMANAANVMELANGVAEGDAGRIAMALLGIGMSMVGGRCFVEGTQIVISDQGHTVYGAPLIVGSEAAEANLDPTSDWRQRALGFVCLGVGLGVYFRNKVDERRRARRKNELLIDAALEEGIGLEPPDPYSEHEGISRKRRPIHGLGLVG